MNDTANILFILQSVDSVLLFRIQVMHVKMDMYELVWTHTCLLFVLQDRMISMTLDKDNEVAVQTMKLLVLISRWVTSLSYCHSYVVLIIFHSPLM